MALHELRRARALAQRDLANGLDVEHTTPANIEERADEYLSNLRSHVEAVGGKLKIVAEFPYGEVTIGRFCEVGDVEELPSAGDEGTRV